MDLFGQTDRDAAIDSLHSMTAIYTAEPVVEQLLDLLAWPQDRRRLVDPSCGDGAFLGRAVQRLLQACPDIDDATLSHVIEGWEIHFFAVSEARSRIASILVEHGRRGSDASAMAEIIARHGDFLMDGPRSPEYHAIAGNPPYLRFVNVPQPLRDEYEQSLPDYAQADMLHSFLDRCALSLHVDGEIAMVTADSTAARLPADELVPAIDTDDIKNGVLGSPNRHAIRTKKEIAPSPAVMAHLDNTLHRMCQRGRKSPRWMPPESFEKFDLTQPYLLVPRIAKSLRPVRVPAGVLAVNHNLSIVSAGGKSLDEIEAFLCSKQAMDWV